MINQIIQGDCVEQLKNLDSNSIDSIVCDPPYELGFMGKSWDNTGIANDKNMWAECLRVLKPGGYLLSFGGTRTYHRMACAIEDAGFEVRDMIEWVYGSGFPKSLNIGKAVDKLQGNEREITGSYKVPDIKGDAYGTMNEKQGGAYKNIEVNKTKGTSEWEGWGTALKPAHEPICMARKPLVEKTVAENVLKYGTGGINIDESRVGTEDIKTSGGRTAYEQEDKKRQGIMGRLKDFQPLNTIHNGRFPANLIHDNSEEVRECFPDSKSTPHNHNHKQDTMIYGGGTGLGIREGMSNFDDSGNASRFFKSIDEDTVCGVCSGVGCIACDARELPEFKSIIYQAKASKSERNKGCEELEEKFAPKGNNEGRDMDNPKNHLGGMQSSIMKNNHPTVKPVALMEYLINMVTPKGGTVLDPFAGSGTTGVACKNTNRNYILIEKEPEYIEIIKSRLANKHMEPNEEVLEEVVIEDPSEKNVCDSCQ